MIPRINGTWKLEENTFQTGYPEPVRKKRTDFGREEYALTVTDKETIVEASCEQGFRLAQATLRQLEDENSILPCVTLHDRPRYAYRGLLLDCVRHYFPISEVKRVLDQMALVKLNALHWVLTNDQGWRLESKAFPKLNETGGPFYTTDEIREVVDFAQQRGIEIIPEIDMPGHMTALLAAYPEYSCSGQPVKTARAGGIFPIILCAGQEKTYELIEKLLDEILPLFPGERIHLGGDEAPKREWKKCPYCQKKMQEEHLANEDALEGYFLNRIIQIAGKHQKKVICWNEALAGGNLDPNVLIQYWTVQHAEEAKRFLEEGGKVIYSDVFNYYFDYPHYFTPLSRVYQDPQEMDDLDVSNRVEGLECCLWTERVETAEKLEMQLFPRLYAFAEAAWCSERNYDDFLRRLPGFLGKHHPAKMACTPPEEWEADMPDRAERVMAYMNSLVDSMSEEAKETTTEETIPSLAMRKRAARYFLGLTDIPQEFTER